MDFLLRYLHSSGSVPAQVRQSLCRRPSVIFRFLLTDIFGLFGRLTMNDEKLIESVRKNIVLYDMANPKYMDSSVKNEIWEKIGAEMNLDGGTCKARWNNIRDTYRKSMKRTATKSGQAAKKIKLYKYSNQLSFLQKYLDERETLSSFSIEDQTSDTQEEQLEDTTANITDDDVQTIEILRNESTKEQVPTPTIQTHKKSTFQLPPKPCVKAVKEITNTNTEVSASSKLMDFIIKDKEKPKPADHPVDIFLKAMAPPLKTLSPYNWHLAKSEIFSVVQKYEMKTLTGQLQPYAIPGSSINLQHSSTPSPSTVQSQSNDSIYMDDTATGATGESNILQNYFQTFT
ncbi:hypothetical protein J6590_052732 [Homalodisca vitripennis]|nr:hypothetical protein J6590_052732 [Homalodisca vitripennis]